MQRLVIASFLLVALLISFSACRKTPELKHVHKTRTSMPKILVLATEDSLAGTSEGWTLSSKGMVIHWTKTLGSALFEETPFQADSVRIGTIITALERSNMLQSALRVKGKKLYRLTYKNGHHTITLSWADSSQLPDDFRRWYTQTLAFCQQFKTKKHDR